MQNSEKFYVLIFIKFEKPHFGSILDTFGPKTQDKIFLKKSSSFTFSLK